MIKTLLSKYQRSPEQADHDIAIKAVLENDILSLEKLKNKNYDFNSFIFSFSESHLIHDRKIKEAFSNAGSVFQHEVYDISLHDSKMNLLSLSVLCFNDLLNSSSIEDVKDSAAYFLIQNNADPFFIKEDEASSFHIPASILAANLILPELIESIFTIQTHTLHINKTYYDGENLLFFIPFKNFKISDEKEEKLLNILDILLKFGIDYQHFNHRGMPFYRKNGYRLDYDLEFIKKIDQKSNLSHKSKEFHFHCLADDKIHNYAKSLNIPFDLNYEIIHFDPTFSINEKHSEILLFEVAKGERSLNDNSSHSEHFLSILSLYGSNLNYTNNQGESILHMLARTNNTDKLFTFISDPNMDLNITDNENNTFLHSIIELKNGQDNQYLNLIFDKIIPTCILLGMNLNRKNNQGVSVSDYLSNDLKSLIRKYEKITLNKTLNLNNDQNNVVNKKRI